MDRIAIVQVDDSFGADAVPGACRASTGDKKPLPMRSTTAQARLRPIMPKLLAKADRRPCCSSARAAVSTA
jgi:hypothetical protein